MIKRINIILWILIGFMLINISDIYAQCAPYLGQTLPTFYLKKFPPTNLLANSNWEWHSTPIFSPDGNEMFWIKIYSNGTGREMWFTKCVNGQWADPQKAPFSTLQTQDNNPQFLESSDTLYFLSLRPGGFIFKVMRTPTGWSEPIALNIPIPTKCRVGLQFSITYSKTVYFEAIDTTSGNNLDIYKSEFINGHYETAVKLNAPINTNGDDFVGYVDRDEKFIICPINKPGSNGDLDLYISKKNPDNTWGTLVNMGTKVNSTSPEFFPTISPDGLYLFVTSSRTGDSGYNPYWINAQFIYDMLTDIKDETANPESFTLNQNFPNPFNPNTVIEYGVSRKEYVVLKIYDFLGKEIETLVNKEQEAGKYLVEFSGAKYSSGIYYYELRAGEFRSIKKMTILK